VYHDLRKRRIIHDRHDGKEVGNEMEYESECMRPPIQGLDTDRSIPLSRSLIAPG